MRLSEMLKNLSELYQHYGDIEVEIVNDSFVLYPVDPKKSHPTRDAVLYRGLTGEEDEMTPL